MESIFKLNKKTAYSGEVIIRYNLKSLLKWLFLIAVIIGIGFLIYAIIAGTIWLFKAMMPVFSWIGEHWLGILLSILGIGALVAGIISGYFKKLWQKIKTKANGKNLWGVLAILLLLLGTFFIWKSCDKEEKQTTEIVYQEAFDDVIVARAYLDGVQQEGAQTALVGLKYIQGLSVKGMSFEGKTYEEAKQIVAEEWRPLVMDNVQKPELLSKQQMSVIILAAMRMGPQGFKNSAFLAKVNAGKYDEATEVLHLQKEGEAPRKVGAEPQKYFYVLRLLWKEQINISELVDYPIMSYLDIPLSEMYNQNGTHRFDAEIQKKLQSGINQSPRQALDL